MSYQVPIEAANEHMRRVSRARADFVDRLRAMNDRHKREREALEAKLAWELRAAGEWLGDQAVRPNA